MSAHATTHRGCPGVQSKCPVPKTAGQTPRGRQLDTCPCPVPVKVQVRGGVQVSSTTYTRRWTRGGACTPSATDRQARGVG